MVVGAEAGEEVDTGEVVDAGAEAGEEVDTGEVVDTGAGVAMGTGMGDRVAAMECGERAGWEEVPVGGST